MLTLIEAWLRFPVSCYSNVPITAFSFKLVGASLRINDAQHPSSWWGNASPRISAIYFSCQYEEGIKTAVPISASTSGEPHREALPIASGSD